MQLFNAYRTIPKLDGIAQFLIFTILSFVLRLLCLHVFAFVAASCLLIPSCMPYCDALSVEILLFFLLVPVHFLVTFVYFAKSFLSLITGGMALAVAMEFSEQAVNKHPEVIHGIHESSVTADIDLY